MPAIRPLAIRPLAHRFAVLCALISGLLTVHIAQAQNIPGIGPNIEASLIAEGPAVPGETVTVAIRFEPVSDEWHGYWKNPGDAGYGMQLEWDLPEGWTAGESQYPVPRQLLIGDLMNHIYEGSYSVLIPISVPATATTGQAVQIGVDAQWLACTDEICVPEQGAMQIALPVGGDASDDSRVMQWQAAIPPVLDSSGTFEIAGETLRISFPIPADFELNQSHVFIAQKDLGNGLQPAYSEKQIFAREGDMLIAELPLLLLDFPDGTDIEFAATPDRVSGILALADGSGLQFSAEEGDVPEVENFFDTSGTFALLLLAAIAGGLILNIMPCVFPILSLKALSLARAGGSEDEARKEGLAYSTGVILACVALGAVMLGLRAAGQQVGWAFQLQEPAVVVTLLVLATAITANLAGLFALPSISLTRSGEPASAFATGLLAAIAATPCTGPFMAAALGAALLLPTAQALALFAALGLGLALPFLLIGFVSPLRRMLPKPGVWMETFRKIMAIPMGLTALALVWLVWRMGGTSFVISASAAALALVAALVVLWRSTKPASPKSNIFALIFLAMTVLFGWQAYQSFESQTSRPSESILDPQEYSAEALRKARASGQPVFVWMTADWCFTCKFNEGVAVEREATRAAFEKAGVIAIRGDWTLRENPVITAYLSEQGVAGIPLYVWYLPGEDGQHLPQILTPDSLVNLAKNAPKLREQSADTPQ